MSPGERSSSPLPVAEEVRAEQSEAARAALARIVQLTRPFRMPRAMEDEPAHHRRALERLAGREEDM